MNSISVKIYSAENVPRLRYIAGLILGDILGLSWEVTTDKRRFGKNPVINYSHENLNGSFKIGPDSLLFETGLTRREINVDLWKGLPVFFMTSTDSDLPFDIFAASFFLVSRYEEYLEFQPDEHLRFPASSSLAFKNGFLAIPVVDLWIKEFAKTLLKKFQSLTFQRNEYNALMSIDSDQAFQYTGNRIFRSLGSMFRSMNTSKGDENSHPEKGSESDPFDVFGYITDKIENSNTETRFFFPVGDSSKYDKNRSWKDAEYRNLINRLNEKFMTGLHISYNAAGDPLKTSTEINRLKSIIGKNISINRFHFLRLFFPRSYRNIQKAGILEDYSMGYPEEPGFRAGTAKPYLFYDVAEDQQTNLKIFPFQVMDETLIFKKKFDPDAAKAIISKLINETRKVGGLFVSIWHNTSLIDDPDYLKWREVFEFTLNQQKP